jgi:hypothetical protein
VTAARVGDIDAFGEDDVPALAMFRIRHSGRSQPPRKRSTVARTAAAPVAGGPGMLW